MAILTVLLMDPTSFFSNCLLSWFSLFLLLLAAAATAFRTFRRKPLRISKPLPIVDEGDDSSASSSEEEEEEEEAASSNEGEDEEKEDDTPSRHGLWLQESSEFRSSRSRKLPDLTDLYTTRDVVKVWNETDPTAIRERSEHDPISMTADADYLTVWDARAPSKAPAMTATWQSSGLRLRKAEDYHGLPHVDLRMGKSLAEASWYDDAALVLTWTGPCLVQI